MRRRPPVVCGHRITKGRTSSVTMGWLQRLVTAGPTGGRGPPTVLEFLVINFRGPDLRK